MYGMLEVGATIANPCGDEGEDFAVLSFLETKSESITSALDGIHRQNVTSTIQELISTMATEDIHDLLGELQEGAERKVGDTTDI